MIFSKPRTQPLVILIFHAQVRERKVGIHYIGWLGEEDIWKYLEVDMANQYYP